MRRIRRWDWYKETAPKIFPLIGNLCEEAEQLLTDKDLNEYEKSDEPPIEEDFCSYTQQGVFQ